MKIFIARPSNGREYYRLEKPLSFQIKEEIEFKDGKETLIETYSANRDQVEVDLPDKEINKISKTILDFLHLQEYLAFKYHGIKND